MARIIRLPGGVSFDYDSVPAGEKAEVDGQLAEFAKLVERNPLQGFEPFKAQRDFVACWAKVKMAIAGNRAGKTEIGVVYDLLQCVDMDCLPSWLKPYKFLEPPVAARVVVGDLGLVLFGVMIPKWQDLVPKDQLIGGSWDKAFEKTLRILRFKNGSTVEFMSTDQEVPKFAGSARDLIHLDEEPPAPNGYAIYRECRKRLIDRAGQMLITMTPLMGLSWTYDELYERRHLPTIDVFQWSMLDNPHLPAAEVQAEIDDIRSEAERKAVVEGQFVHFRGRVLEEFDPDRHLVDPPTREHVKGLDTVIGIDPGIARGGVVWVGFDRNNDALVYDELYPEGLTVKEIAKGIRERNAFWGVTPDYYVIDPSAVNRSLTSGETVESVYRREGINCIHGENDRMGGIVEMKGRLEAGTGLLVARNCVKWLFEQDRWLVAGDEITGEQRPGKGVSFTTIGPDHLQDPTRYVLMSRPYGMPDHKESPTSRGYRPTFDPELEAAWSPSRPAVTAGPMGTFA